MLRFGDIKNFKCTLVLLAFIIKNLECKMVLLTFLWAPHCAKHFCSCGLSHFKVLHNPLRWKLILFNKWGNWGTGWLRITCLRLVWWRVVCIITEIQCISSDCFFFFIIALFTKSFGIKGTTLFIRILDNLDPDSFQAYIEWKLTSSSINEEGCFLTVLLHK